MTSYVRITGLKQLEYWESRYNTNSGTNKNMQLLFLSSDTSVLTEYLREVKERLRRKKDPRLAAVVLRVHNQVANRLGLQRLRQELEDTAFQIAYPRQYAMTLKLLRQNSANNAKDITRLKDMLGQLISEIGITAWEIDGRSKKPYSLYKKLYKTGTIADIHDILALRILTETETECYQALDVMHKAFEPNLQRYKDYIKRPKENGYQSLHTTVYWGKKTVELQIRTFAMHRRAEGGTAAHWQYDEHKDTKRYRRGQVAAQAKTNFPAATYVFSPNGDVYQLPATATPLDFAFTVHTSIGLRTKGAKVNGVIAKIGQRLHQGDTVEIITGPTANPKRDWLRIVTDRKARNKIRAWLKQVDRERHHSTGKQILIDNLGGLTPEDFGKILSRYKLIDTDDLLVSIGAGQISIETIRQHLRYTETARHKVSKLAINKQPQALIAGMKGLQYRLGSCCNPQPPSKITGYSTRSLGITVHRSDCLQLENGDNRLIDCAWD